MMASGPDCAGKSSTGGLVMKVLVDLGYKPRV